jgi:outer membrane protein TolC
MKKIMILLSFIFPLRSMQAQIRETLTLQESYDMSTANYPLIKQRDLIAKSEAYSISNASKGVWPVLSVHGQDSYQSAVTQIPTQSPEMNIEPLSKHQYKVYGDVSVNIYDGGQIKNQKQSYRAAAKVEEQQLEVELHKLKDRVNQLFFGILLLDAQLKQNDLLKEDINRGILRAQASIANGAALKSSVDVLQAELLKANQKTIELSVVRSGYVEMLGLMTGRTLTDSTNIETPPFVQTADSVKRPELSLYTYQSEVIDVQNKMVTARTRPKLSLFFQGGYGRPALNMLRNDAEAYYITGIRLNWTISPFYTLKKERALLDMKRSSIDIQRETFLYNTNLAIRNQQSEVNKLQQMLPADDEIISLREKIKSTASAQLADGVINSTDYMREVTAEDQARQLKIIHQIQLLLAQYTVKTTKGI